LYIRRYEISHSVLNVEVLNLPAKPSKLSRYLDTVQKDYVDKRLEFLQQQLKEITASRSVRT
jgi:hypothetical protein